MGSANSAYAHHIGSLTTPETSQANRLCSQFDRSAPQANSSFFRPDHSRPRINSSFFWSNHSCPLLDGQSSRTRLQSATPAPS